MTKSIGESYTSEIEFISLDSTADSYTCIYYHIITRIKKSNQTKCIWIRNLREYLGTTARPRRFVRREWCSWPRSCSSPSAGRFYRLRCEEILNSSQIINKCIDIYASWETPETVTREMGRVTGLLSSQCLKAMLPANASRSYTKSGKKLSFQHDANTSSSRPLLINGNLIYKNLLFCLMASADDLHEYISWGIDIHISKGGTVTEVVLPTVTIT